jgi:ribosomal protein S18 acetylase RimI-like enzyme
VHEVRKANPGDVHELSAALARAFDDDPVMRWAFPRARLRAGLVRRFFKLRMRRLLGHDEIYTVRRVGGALWAPPGRWRVSAREQLELLVRLAENLGPHTPRVLRGLHEIEEHHPSDPHFYLAVLGVDPPVQGRGMGSALMGPVLRACDGDGVPAYLESSKERNVDFYSRHGFRVIEELSLPAGPPVWLMWREPR